MTPDNFQQYGGCCYKSSEIHWATDSRILTRTLISIKQIFMHVFKLKPCGMFNDYYGQM
jgi:hypothetical protein